jgi:hypothetical protein
MTGRETETELNHEAHEGHDEELFHDSPLMTSW